MENSFFIAETPSTNALLWELLRKEQLPEGYVVHTNFQSAGKGQSGNSWESENAQNLLFSILFYPQKIPTEQLFLISQIVCLGIKKTLDTYTSGIEVKWPNDIYWNNKKLAGILVENSFQANKVKTVVGIGLNVNQQFFLSNAPNPVSLSQIIGHLVSREALLDTICKNIMAIYVKLDAVAIRLEYAQILFRRTGFHSFSAEEAIFQAKIIAVLPDGQLQLETTNAEKRAFYFKEVQFIL